MSPKALDNPTEVTHFVCRSQWWSQFCRTIVYAWKWKEKIQREQR